MGRAAREAVLRQVPLWRKQWALDFVIVNGENAPAVTVSHRLLPRLFSRPVLMSFPPEITFGTSRKFKAISTVKTACCGQ